jgi:hypothetical protein
MLGTVKLGQAEVLKMFNSAPKQDLFLVATGRREWNSYFESLGDEIEVYRGISTGSQLHENGFSWTTDAGQAWKFAALNTHTKKEIPGVISARVPKQAILAVFDYESEIVVNPTLPKRGISIQYLKGSALREFYRNNLIGKSGRVPGIGML